MITNANAELRCKCGQVRAVVTNASPQTANRVVCYCADCQAFAHRLGRADMLDPHGGSDIIQVAPDSYRFVQGQDRIRGVRLSPKGLYRWYATCCNTPVGNTVSPSVPFVGMLASVFDHDMQRANDVFGAPTGAVFGKYAVGEAPPDSKRIKLSLLFRVLGKVIGWRLRGKAWPHPFFERSAAAPIYPVDVLSREERDALRPMCGPRPTVRA